MMVMVMSDGRLGCTVGAECHSKYPVQRPQHLDELSFLQLSLCYNNYRCSIYRVGIAHQVPSTARLARTCTMCTLARRLAWVVAFRAKTR